MQQGQPNQSETQYIFAVAGEGGHIQQLDNFLAITGFSIPVLVFAIQV